MNRPQMRFPEMCAWCALRSPTTKRAVKLSSSSSRRSSNRLRVEFSAPICPECAAYAQKLENNLKKMHRLIVKISFVIGLGLSILIFVRDEPVLVVLMWPFVSVFVMSMIMLPVYLLGIAKRVSRRGADDPPLEYASESYDPCALYTSGTLQFYNEAYQQQFMELNPEWARKPTS